MSVAFSDLTDDENKLKKTLGKTAGLAETDEEEIQRVRPLLRPLDQENLSEEQLKEEITKVLTTINPTIPEKEAEYNFAKGEFVQVLGRREQKSYPLYSLQGTAIKKDGAEARAQIAAGYATVSLEDSGAKKPKAKKSAEEEEEEEDEEQAGEEKEEAEEEPENAEDEEQNHEEKGTDAPTGASDDEGLSTESTDGLDLDEEPIFIPPKITKLSNQFNFCERGTLTVNCTSRTVETQTFPPPRATFSATAIQSAIYDFYQDDYELKEKEREDEKPKKPKKKVPQLKEKTDKEIHDEKVQERTKEGWTILERLVNQNIYDEIGHDYRYYEDPSDEFREGDGSLLPLWRFSYEKMISSTVTALAWNPYYYDLFAVAYGSFDFINSQKEGCLCLFTVKNPSYPEYIVTTESPVICLDIHKKYPYLIVAGFYDGNVAVYNAQLTNEKSHQYKSDSVESKHSSLVWDIKWGPDLADGECCFWSVSGDGKVVSWTVLPSELLAATAIHLILPESGLSSSPIRGCGTCLTFHPFHSEVYLVGTEEGLILRCSRAYSRAFLGVQNAHRMPVHAINYNSYDGNVYATCSADWRVKIWEDGREEPLFMFDLGSSVGDVKWAPYSSTVFAACTIDGKVFVYDLNVNKYKPICVQNIVSKKIKKLTRLEFNHELPVLICGDSKGSIHMLKLSPNLRVMCKPPKKQQNLDQKTLQEMKLAKLLSLVRDPPTTQEVVDEKVEED